MMVMQFARFAWPLMPAHCHLPIPEEIPYWQYIMAYKKKGGTTGLPFFVLRSPTLIILEQRQKLLWPAIGYLQRLRAELLLNLHRFQKSAIAR